VSDRRPYYRVLRLFLAVATLGTLCSSCGGGTTSTSVGSSPLPAPANLSLTLAWEGPTDNADGSTPLADLVGYRVYLSATAGQYSRVATREISASTPGATEQVTIGGLAAGTYYVVVTARDSSNNESIYSDEISVTLP
jgi:hypothetical protein